MTVKFPNIEVSNEAFIRINAALIKQAVSDVCTRQDCAVKIKAWKFINSSAFDNTCHVLDIDPDKIRHKLKHDRKKITQRLGSQRRYEK
jgi:hypothetical protein